MCGHLGHPEQRFPNVKAVSVSLDDPRSAVVRAIKTQAPVIVEDTTDYRLSKNWLNRTFNARSLIAVPIISGHRVLGCAVSIETEFCRHFSDDDVSKAQELTASAAKAIEEL